jgi:hypothetical protein
MRRRITVAERRRPLSRRQTLFQENTGIDPDGPPLRTSPPISSRKRKKRQGWILIGASKSRLCGRQSSFETGQRRRWVV